MVQILPSLSGMCACPDFQYSINQLDAYWELVCFNVWECWEWLFLFASKTFELIFATVPHCFQCEEWHRLSGYGLLLCATACEWKLTVKWNSACLCSAVCRLCTHDITQMCYQVHYVFGFQSAAFLSRWSTDSLLLQAFWSNHFLDHNTKDVRYFWNTFCCI